MVSKTYNQSNQCSNSLYYYDLANNLINPGPPAVSTVKWTDSITYGDNIPDWKEALRDGRNATTSMDGRKGEVRVKSGAWTFRHKNPNVNLYIKTRGTHGLYHGIPGGDPASISVGSADNLALGKFQQKLSLVNAAIQGGVVIGELRQTLQTIRNPALGLRRLVDDGLDVLRAIRAGRRLAPMATHIRGVTKNLADAWLELQYGWRPLMNDIRDADKALHRYNIGRPVSVKRITAVEKVQGSANEVQSLGGESFAIWLIRQTQTNNVQVIYRGAVRLKAQDPKTMDPALFGFSPNQFLPTAWELIPYSFLVDYFSNIGGIVYGLSNLFTELAWCNRTVRRQIELKQYAQEYKHPDITVSGVQAEIISSANHVSRATYTGTTVPGVAFKIPGNWSLKWLNIAALVAARGGDRKWTFN
jgi:hypothetical protein